MGPSSITSFLADKTLCGHYLNSDKIHQYYFDKFLFHSIEVGVGIDFARKKNLF
jgi:hypothetical protein